jgi:hypothetical protein
MPLSSPEYPRLLASVVVEVRYYRTIARPTEPKPNDGATDQERPTPVLALGRHMPRRHQTSRTCGLEASWVCTGMSLQRELRAPERPPSTVGRDGHGDCGLACSLK